MTERLPGLTKPVGRPTWTPLLLLALTLLLSGCVNPVDQTADPVNPTPDRKPQPVSGSLEQAAYESFQARDRVRAEKLNQLADDIAAGRVKYGNAIMKAIQDAGISASAETWKPVQDRLGNELDGASLEAPLDLAKAEKTVRDLAKAADRAGGGK